MIKDATGSQTSKQRRLRKLRIQVKGLRIVFRRKFDDLRLGQLVFAAGKALSDFQVLKVEPLLFVFTRHRTIFSEAPRALTLRSRRSAIKDSSRSPDLRGGRGGGARFRIRALGDFGHRLGGVVHLGRRARDGLHDGLDLALQAAGECQELVAPLLAHAASLFGRLLPGQDRRDGLNATIVALCPACQLPLKPRPLLSGLGQTAGDLAPTKADIP
jgi:hypothetical protein